MLESGAANDTTDIRDPFSRSSACLLTVCSSKNALVCESGCVCGRNSLVSLAQSLIAQQRNRKGQSDPRASRATSNT